MLRLPSVGSGPPAVFDPLRTSGFMIVSPSPHTRPTVLPGGLVKLYRIDKVARLGGVVLKRKHVLAASNKEAMKRADDSADCPTCEVVGEDGKSVGSIV